MNYEKGDDLNIYRPVMSNRSPPDCRKVGVVSVVAESPAFIVGDVLSQISEQKKPGNKKTVG